MENTPENKAKYFGCHYDVEYRQNNGVFNKISPYAFMWDIVEGNSHLLLTPISQITDEDAIQTMLLVMPSLNDKTWEVIRIKRAGPNIFIEFKWKDDLFKKGWGFSEYGFSAESLEIEQYQYLQSVGTALKWHSLSIEELINRGWMKLKGE